MPPNYSEYAGPYTNRITHPQTTHKPPFGDLHSALPFLEAPILIRPILLSLNGSSASASPPYAAQRLGQCLCGSKAFDRLFGISNCLQDFGGLQGNRALLCGYAGLYAACGVQDPTVSGSSEPVINRQPYPTLT